MVHQLSRWSFALAVVVLTIGVILPGSHAAAQDAPAPAGFNMVIQSGSCAEPTDDIRISPSHEGDAFAIYPYSALAEVDPGADADEGDVILFYGSRSLPGFGIVTLFGDLTYFIAITDESGETVACGDIRQPAEGAFVNAGTILTLLAPVGPNGVNGVAIFERGQTALDAQQQEPPRVRVILLVGVAGQDVPPATPAAA
ncbi:MAG: hypothetical protein KF883_01420 [Thermomicrobiales bacterium]|nr:hypothetical protein [Thermomicrobiales bacterium]